MQSGKGEVLGPVVPITPHTPAHQQAVSAQRLGGGDQGLGLMPAGPEPSQPGKSLAPHGPFAVSGSQASSESQKSGV